MDKNSIFKKIIIIVAIAVIIQLVIVVAIPFIKSLQQEELARQISLEAASSEAKPVAVTFGGDYTFKVDLALDNNARERGLSNTFFLDDDKGLLFVFEKSGHPEIWMKEMIYSLDIAWLDSGFNVVHLEKNVAPTTYPETFGSEKPARYVLEVNAGFFDKHQVVEGSKLVLVDTHAFKK